eukprot:TRINITY_DN27659_c0_g1_i1.p1 TRINITY_DN27659_c0_g1~~TRINITY_DN27659_c0_g1_i1.p1  ORF type:complete len:658 (+),score=196.53 TRINITY_DN27659_c0_g1_i1:53-1975(+)
MRALSESKEFGGMHRRRRPVVGTLGRVRAAARRGRRLVGCLVASVAVIVAVEYAARSTGGADLPQSPVDAAPPVPALLGSARQPGVERRKRERSAWAEHYRAAEAWLASASRHPIDLDSAQASEYGVALPAEVSLLKKCISQGADAAALLVSASNMGVHGDAEELADDARCGGSCCPDGSCLFCSAGCSGLPASCSGDSDVKAIRSVWRLRAARQSGRESTAAIGEIGTAWQHCALCGAEWAQEFVAGQVDRARSLGRIPADREPLWRVGEAAEEQPELDLSTGGGIVVLYSGLDVMVWRMLRSLCSHLRAAHPLLLMLTSKAPPEHVRDAIAMAAAGPGCPQRQVWFLHVSAETWTIDSEDRQTKRKEQWGVSEPGGYRRMCWFWHRSVHWLPVVRQLRALMRLDTDSELVSTPTKDPIAEVLSKGAVYGFIAFCFDNPGYTTGLWQHFEDWRRENAASETPLTSAPDTRNCPVPLDVEHGSALALDRCHVPMFYTNFEILVPEFFRRPAVDRWMRSVASGVRLYRWGDAPLRALTLSLFAQETQIVHFDFSYRHGRWSEDTGQTRGTLPKKNELGMDWTRTDFPRLAESRDPYFLGVCFRRPLSEQAAPTPQAVQEEESARRKTRRDSASAYLRRIGR